MKRRRYEVLSRLGAGGFGAVYRARMLSAGAFEREVALKLLNHDTPDEVDAVERLRDEARMLGLLQHPNIVQVLHLTRLEPGWAVVMELVEGVPLSALSRAGVQVPHQVAAELGAMAADALWAAWEEHHHQGRALRLLHRDIKPSNILVGERGEVKVLDFGIASATMSTREARTGAIVLGTYEFMAPERMRGQDTHQADVYALGATLVEILSGEPWGRVPNSFGLHSEAIAARLDAVPALPDGLRRVLEDMLATEPEDRILADEAHRRLLDWRRSHPTPILRDWCREVVGPLRRARADDRRGAGSVYTERYTDASGELEPAEEHSAVVTGLPQPAQNPPEPPSFEDAPTTPAQAAPLPRWSPPSLVPLDAETLPPPTYGEPAPWARAESVTAAPALDAPARPPPPGATGPLAARFPAPPVASAPEPNPAPPSPSAAPIAAVGAWVGWAQALLVGAVLLVAGWVGMQIVVAVGLGRPDPQEAPPGDAVAEAPAEPLAPALDEVEVEDEVEAVAAVSPATDAGNPADPVAQPQPPPPSPDAAPSPAPSPAPRPAPRPAPKPKKPAYAEITVTGDLRRAELLAPNGDRLPIPGQVPPGEYEVIGLFKAGSSSAAQLTLAPGDRIRLECYDQFNRCRVVNLSSTTGADGGSN